MLADSGIEYTFTGQMEEQAKGDGVFEQGATNCCFFNPLDYCNAV